MAIAAVMLSIASVCLCQGPKYIDKDKVVYALNCGSNQGFVSEYGFTYGPDKYYKEGLVADYPNNHPNMPAGGIKYTNDRQLHQNERYNTKEWLEYELPIPEDGDYVLILQFCELNFFYTNQRVCHIYLGDTVIRPNHDTLKGGRQSQVNIYVPFTVKRGQVTYAKYMDCANAIEKEGNKLRLRFKKVIDNPKIDGIILFKGKLEETNFFHIDDLRRQYDARNTNVKVSEQLRDVMMEEYMKKKRMKKPRRNDRDEQEEYEKNYIEIEENPSSGMKKTILMGIILLVAAYVLFSGFLSGPSQQQDELSPDIIAKKRAHKKYEPVPESQKLDKENTSKEHSPDKQNSKQDEEESEEENKVDDRTKAKAGGKKKGKKK